MRKIVITEFYSLDGVIEDPGGSEHFKYGGWTFAYWNDDIGKVKYDELKNSDVHLLGRITYDGFAAAWPNMTNLGEFADWMNNRMHYVVSDSMKEGHWGPTTILTSKNFVTELKKLKKQEGKDILVAGSATLASALIENDLVDQINLVVYPVALGQGKRLFKENAFDTFKVVESRPLGKDGVMLLILAPEKSAKEKILKAKASRTQVLDKSAKVAKAEKSKK